MQMALINIYECCLNKNFCFNGYYYQLRYPTPTPAPSRTIVIILNAIEKDYQKLKI